MVSSGSMDFIQSQYSDIMVRHSVFVGLVFLVIAHPETFKFVDKYFTLFVKKVFMKNFTLNKNALLVLHAVVTGVIFYIGTSVITPYTDFYMQGFKTNKGKKNKAVKPVKKIGRVPRPSNI